MTINLEPNTHSEGISPVLTEVQLAIDPERGNLVH
jgi:hypothetical protein